MIAKKIYQIFTIFEQKMSKSELIKIPRLFTTAAGYHRKKLFSYCQIPKFSPLKKCTTFCKIYEQNMSKVYSGFFKGYF